MLESGELRVLLLYLRDRRLEGLELEVSSPLLEAVEELQRSILQAVNREFVIRKHLVTAGR